MMETRSDPCKLNKAFLQLGFTGYAFSKLRGFAGGISMGWKPGNVQIKTLKNHFQFLHTKISAGVGCDWFLTAVSADPKEEGKKELWKV